MNDYKELIEILRDETFCGKLDYVEDAADAIEQLVKERDELYEEVMDCTKKIGCKAIEQVKKERDAAIADITELLRQPEVVTRCWACAKWEADGKFVNCSQTSNDCTAECSEAEWRGVQE